MIGVIEDMSEKHHMRVCGAPSHFGAYQSSSTSHALCSTDSQNQQKSHSKVAKTSKYKRFASATTCTDVCIPHAHTHTERHIPPHTRDSTGNISATVLPAQIAAKNEVVPDEKESKSTDIGNDSRDTQLGKISPIDTNS